MSRKSIHVFVDGSSKFSTNENTPDNKISVESISAGCVLVRDNKIFAQMSLATKNIYGCQAHPHEIFAINTGLQLAQEISDVDIIHLYSDCQIVINKMRQNKVEETHFYNNTKPFFKKLLNLVNKLQKNDKKVIFHFISDFESNAMKLAHRLSRKIYYTDKSAIIGLGSGLKDKILLADAIYGNRKQHKQKMELNKQAVN